MGRGRKGTPVRMGVLERTAKTFQVEGKSLAVAAASAFGFTLKFHGDHGDELSKKSRKKIQRQKAVVTACLVNPAGSASLYYLGKVLVKHDHIAPQFLHTEGRRVRFEQGDPNYSILEGDSLDILSSGQLDMDETLASQAVPLLLKADLISVGCEIHRGDESNVEILFFATENAMERHPDQTEAVLGRHFRNLLNELQSLSVKEEDPSEPGGALDHGSIRPEDIYRRVRPAISQSNLSLLETSKFESMTTRLRNYQKLCAAWMVGRELGTARRSSKQHPLWESVPARGCCPSYYMNSFSGEISLEQPGWNDEVCGGILADEMGLGKTVELLACIVANPMRNVVDYGMPEAIASAEDETCFCGSSEDDARGFWVQCDECDRWCHGSCVDFTEEDADQAFECPACEERAMALQSIMSKGIHAKSTLIVCPSTIVRQWKSELVKHTREDHFSVVIYEGIKEKGFMDPRVLVSHDIVLTTYETLRSEVYHVGLDSNRFMLRKRKRYKVVETPMTAIVWWRVCLDEAQMVENVTARAAEMALHLRAVYRWCVTGTPIMRGLEDLYGLMVFLRAEPFNERRWWTRAIEDCMHVDRDLGLNRLCGFLDGLMWRHSKSDVVNELNIPCQTEIVHNVRFSAVESHFYRRQAEKGALLAREMLRKVELREDKELTESEAKKLLHSLIVLRQACCHPQIGRHGIKTLTKNTMNMNELLDNLITKASLECEEAQRALVAALNGLAGVHILEESKAAAVNLYRKAILTADDNNRLYGIRVDSLQRLHSYHNLAQLLSDPAIKSSVDRTIEDDTLPEKVAEIRHEYIWKFESSKKLEHAKLRQVSLDIENSDGLSGYLRGGEKSRVWWVDALKALESWGNHDDLIHQIHSKMISGKEEDRAKGQGLAAVQQRFKSISGLRFWLSGELENMMNNRSNILRRLEELAKDPSDNDVFKSGECRVCRKELEKKGEPCDHCRLEVTIQAYEKKVYSARTQAVNKAGGASKAGDVEDQFEDDGFLVDDSEPAELNPADRRTKKNTRILWADSDIETAMKVMFSYCRSIGWRALGIDDTIARHSVGLYDSIRKEFKSIREAWRTQKELLSAMDELQMSLLRIRFRAPGESVSKINENFIISYYDTDEKKQVLVNDEAVANADLDVSKGQLNYLRNLKRARENMATRESHDYRNDSDDKDLCPVCLQVFDQNVVIFPCGHIFCYECVVRLIEDAPGKHIRCPTCRVLVNIREISYVGENCDDRVESIPPCPYAGGCVETKGSYGTKIDLIMKKILQIELQEPEAKSIVFSQWNEVLDIVAAALKENSIVFEQVKSNRKQAAKAIEDYIRTPDTKVLLIPLSSGSNGLNIIEATHVFLAEPSLNPGVEAQAINRVYRIGQTKRTYVHRFIVRDTVEEKVLSMNKQKSSTHDSHATKRTNNKSHLLSLSEWNDLLGPDLGGQRLSDRDDVRLLSQ